MKMFLFFFFLILFQGCSKQNAGPEIINIEEAFQNQQSAILSKFVSDVKYIPLELTSESAISDYPAIIVDEYIIVRNTGLNNSTPLMLFNKEDGKFIRYIGKVGRGPNEYSSIVKDFYNIYTDQIYTADNALREIKILNLDGAVIDRFNILEISDPSLARGVRRISFDTYLANDTFVSYINNSTGSIEIKLVLFDKENVLKIYPNYLKWGDSDPKKNNSPYFSPKFFSWDKNLFFKEMFNDTLFQVTQEALIPLFVFNLGKKGLPYEQQNKIMPTFGQLDNNYFLIEDLDGNSNFMFFQLAYQLKTYTGFFDKKSKKTTICKFTENSASALIDDINNFMPLIPKAFTQNNEMICILNPMDVMNWIKKNPEKAKILKAKMGWLNSLSFNSNPIIVIAKCK
jgi:hypothetical protein